LLLHQLNIFLICIWWLKSERIAETSKAFESKQLQR